MFLFAPVRWAFRLVSFAITAAVIYVVVCGFQVVSAANSANAKPASTGISYVVVTGAPVPSGEIGLGTDLLARLKETVAIHTSNPNTRIIVAGPSDDGGTSVAETAGQWLANNGIPASDIDEVTTSNAKEFNAVRLKMGNARRAVVVTDAIDSLWANRAASHAGISPVIAVPTSSEKVFFAELSPLWREATGIALGRLIGYDNVSWAAS